MTCPSELIFKRGTDICICLNKICLGFLGGVVAGLISTTGDSRGASVTKNIHNNL